MEQTVCPVDVICVCLADGGLRPLRMRIEDSQQQWIRVDIDEILDCRDIRYVGIESKIFLCRAIIGGRSCLFELKYALRTHSWSLTRKKYYA